MQKCTFIACIKVKSKVKMYAQVQCSAVLNTTELCSSFNIKLNFGLKRTGNMSFVMFGCFRLPYLVIQTFGISFIDDIQVIELVT